jgi:Ca-activated chloride channel homolog
MKTAELKLSPLVMGLKAGRTTELEVLLSVSAPERAAPGARKRPKLNLAIVLDRSGSMDGQPLEEAKKCAAYIAGRLQPDDRVSIVTYDNEATVVVPSQLAGSGGPILQRIESIRVGGCTNLFGGWERGLSQVSPYRAPDVLTRILLLSDGRANAGVTDPQAIFSQCKRAAATGVTTSTYGLGRGFDESLMTGIAKAGRGNAYYGNTAKDLMDPVQEELDLLSAVFATDVVVRLAWIPEARLTVLNRGFSAGPNAVRLPDLAFESEGWAVLRMSVPPLDAPLDNSRAIRVLRAKAEFTLVDGTRATTGDWTELSLPVLEPGEFDALPGNRRLRERLVELKVAEIEHLIGDAAIANEWDEVNRLLRQAELEGIGNGPILRTLEQLREIALRRDSARMSKESMYSATQRENRLSSSSARQPDSSFPKYLRPKPLPGSGER